MAKYLFVYHGGRKPESQEEIDQVMADWKNWFAAMGDQVADGGNPVGISSTVESDGSVSDHGGANPVSGYSMITADSIEAALEQAKGCPILAAGGSVEVAEIVEIM